MLAYLAIEGAKTRRELAELLWWEARDPRDSLSTTVRRLNRGTSTCVVAHDDHLGTEVGCDAVELEAAARAGDPRRVVELYRGPFLEGFGLPLREEIEEWVYATRERLANRACQAHLALAREAAAAEAREEVALHADRALALEHNAWTADDLVDMRDLLRAIGVRREREVERAAARSGLVLDSVPANSSATPPSNLPHVATSFVGRDAQVQRIVELASGPRARLICLHGPGGVGKSRLAAEVARTLLDQGATPDGAYFVSLEHAEDAENVPSAVAASLGINLTPGLAGDEQIVARIGARRMLLVLDNFEHLAELSTLPAAALRGCPNVRLLVTSRRTLNLEEEHVVPVPGLGTDEAASTGALRLLHDRVRQRGAEEPQEANMPAHRRICELLDGNPLAIELAAAFTRVLDPDEIAAQLETGLDLLVSRDPTVPERHRSMNAALEASWKLLRGPDRDALARLAAFQGGFTRSAAESVAAVGTATLERLVDAALVRPLPSGRFQRHPLIHQFTVVKLAERQLMERDVKERHARHFLQQCATLDHDLHGGATSIGALAWFDAEFPNLQTAWAWGVDHGTTDLLRQATWALAHYAELRGRYGDAIPMMERAVARIRAEATGKERTAALGDVLGCLAFMRFRVGHIDTALEMAHEALALLETGLAPSGNWGWWTARQALAMAHVFRSEHAEAEEHLRVSIARSEQDRANAGRDPRLERIADYCIGTSREVVAYMAMHEGRFQGALDELRRAQERFEPHQSPALGYVYWNLGQVHLAMDAVEAAQEALTEGLHYSRAIGYDAHVGQILNELVRVHVRLGNVERAEATAREALDVAQRTGDKWLETSVLAAHGASAAAAGWRREARVRFLASIRAARAAKGYTFAIEALQGLACLWAEEGRVAESVELLAFVRHSPVTPTAIARTAGETLARLAEGMEEEAYHGAWRRGRSLRAEDAFALPGSAPHLDAAARGG